MFACADNIMKAESHRAQRGPASALHDAGAQALTV